MKQKLSKYGEQFVKQHRNAKNEVANPLAVAVLEKYTSRIMASTPFTIDVCRKDITDEVHECLLDLKHLPYPSMSIDTKIDNLPLLITLYQPSEGVISMLVATRMRNKWVPGLVHCVSRNGMVHFDRLDDELCFDEAGEVEDKKTLSWSHLVLGYLLLKRNLSSSKSTIKTTKPLFVALPEIPFDSHIVQIIQPAVEHEPTGKTCQGSAKREHPRMGHWCVRKKSGKRYWTNACIVKKGTLGKITKEYIVK